MEHHHYRRAKRKVNRKKRFFYHFAVYIACIFFFFLINNLTDPWDQWWPFPAVSWGLFLFFHFLFAVGIPFFKLGKDWEDREIEKEMRRMDYNTKSRPDAPLDIDEELELKDFKKLREEWDDQEFV